MLRFIKELEGDEQGPLGYRAFLYAYTSNSGDNFEVTYNFRDEDIKGRPLRANPTYPASVPETVIRKGIVYVRFDDTTTNQFDHRIEWDSDCGVSIDSLTHNTLSKRNVSI